MVEVCKKIIPYKCAKCGQEMLFFYTDNGLLIDYRVLFEKEKYNLFDIAEQVNDLVGATQSQLIVYIMSLVFEQNKPEDVKKGCWISARMCVVPMMPFSMLMLTSFLTVQTL